MNHLNSQKVHLVLRNERFCERVLDGSTCYDFPQVRDLKLAYWPPTVRNGYVQSHYREVCGGRFLRNRNWDLGWILADWQYWKKRVWDDYEQLLRAVFSGFQRQNIFFWFSIGQEIFSILSCSITDTSPWDLSLMTLVMSYYNGVKIILNSNLYI